MLLVESQLLLLLSPSLLGALQLFHPSLLELLDRILILLLPIRCIAALNETQPCAWPVLRPQRAA